MAKIGTAKRKYKGAVKTAYENGNYAEGIADFFDVSKGAVEDSGPVKSWNDKFDTEDDRSQRADNWEDKLKTAFGVK